jgi:hypothetical protein
MLANIWFNDFVDEIPVASRTGNIFLGCKWPERENSICHIQQGIDLS